MPVQRLQLLRGVDFIKYGPQYIALPGCRLNHLNATDMLIPAIDHKLAEPGTFGSQTKVRCNTGPDRFGTRLHRINCDLILMASYDWGHSRIHPNTKAFYCVEF